MLVVEATQPESIAKWLLNYYPSSFKPKVGIVLGSGLGDFGKQIKHAVSIPYESIPGFPKTSVQGHHGELIMGYCQEVPVVCLKGRAHLYEGTSPEYIKTYVRTLKCLGCEIFLATNASGSLDPNMPPGAIMMITDHINFMPLNPLTGPNQDEFGPRFLPVDNAYAPELQSKLLAAANINNIPLFQGVYLATQGPQYETAAEIRAFRILGADAVGMSTVPEVLIAHHAGMKVAALATITNFATGLAKTAHSHDEVVKVAEKASENLSTIVNTFLNEI